MTTLTDNATTIEIKGASYAVEPIPAGEFGLAAARVTKLVNGETYDVIRTHDGRCECSCADFECRHRGLPTEGCKHIRVLKVAGFLDAPAPIEADDDDADDFGPEGDSWTAWPESLDRWDIEPEPIEPARSDIDLSGFVPLAPAVVEAAPLDPFDDHWLGETAALLVTTSAIEDGDDGAYFRLDPEYREAFWGFVGSLGWPCATWPAWLALCEAGSPVSFPEPPEPRRTWSPRSEATPAEKAEAASLLRDDRPGAYFVIAPRRARSIHSTPSYRVEGIASEPHHAELAEAGGSCFARCHFA
jgi:hypothetical protein